jgi:hypothetical protein
VGVVNVDLGVGSLLVLAWRAKGLGFETKRPYVALVLPLIHGRDVIHCLNFNSQRRDLKSGRLYLVLSL